MLTPNEIDVILAHVSEKMIADGLTANFVNACVERARTFAGMFDLLLLWRAEKDGVLREIILEDLREALGWTGDM